VVAEISRPSPETIAIPDRDQSRLARDQVQREACWREVELASAFKSSDHRSANKQRRWARAPDDRKQALYQPG
jgi:hypothetical protein